MTKFLSKKTYKMADIMFLLQNRERKVSLTIYEKARREFYVCLNLILTSSITTQQQHWQTDSSLLCWLLWTVMILILFSSNLFLPSSREITYMSFYIINSNEFGNWQEIRWNSSHKSYENHNFYWYFMRYALKEREKILACLSGTWHGI